MTAEQLEELLAILNTTGEGDAKAREAARDMLYDFSPPLARRVIAAEKLVEALDNLIFAQDHRALPWGSEHWHNARKALTAYREASK